MISKQGFTISVAGTIICILAVFCRPGKYERVERMRKSARRNKRLICLVALFVTIVLLYLWISFKPPLWYYTQVTLTPRELPTRLVRPAFRWITEWDLPSKTEKLRAIFHGGRDPSIFVRFQTDSKGILYIKEQLAEQLAPFRGEFEPFTGIPEFVIVSQWQNKFGLDVLDRHPIESGLRFRYVVVSGVCYNIIIDTQRNNLYMRATRM